MRGRHEIVGVEDIVGDWDQSEMVGAGLVPQGATQVGRTAYRNRPLSKGRVLPLPLSSNGNVAANSTATVQNQPQTLFRAERWIIQDPIPSFTISDFKVGKNSIFVAPGTVPTAAFANNAFGARLLMDSAQVSMIISTIVNNITGAAAAFVSTVMGTSIE